MTRKVRCLWPVVGLLLATPALAQETTEERHEEGGRPGRATKIPTEGFWPTRTMMDRMIDRLTDQISQRYEFDDEQLRLTRELFKARFPAFLNDNRAEIQTLMNQYFEAVLYDEPPEVGDVAEWAQRVQPLLEEFRGVVEEITDGMGEYLTEDQQVTLDAEFAAFQTGVTMAQNKLTVWAEGGYDPETEWIRPGPERRQHEREERRRTRQAMDEARREVVEEGVSPNEAAAAAAEAAGSESPIAGAKPASKPQKDKWTIYTERFVERYQLNAEQQQKAYLFLRRQQEERDQYLRRKTDDMRRVTELLQTADTEPERKAALSAYERLNAPVERMFQQLKDRLNTLPTRAQRRAAAEAGLQRDRTKPETAPSSRPSVGEQDELEPQE